MESACATLFESLWKLGEICSEEDSDAADANSNVQFSPLLWLLLKEKLHTLIDKIKGHIVDPNVSILDLLYWI